jgi:glycosyltransferase involved in cell wall biosynthesis
MIPIIIICYNNYKYVDNTIRQLVAINESYLPYIQIMNNASTDQDTIEYLEQVHVKVIHTENNGPRISKINNQHIYDTLPDKFILTDADLEFNINLPNNFIEQLVSLSDIYNCTKIGFALKIDDYADMIQGEYFNGVSIYDWEFPAWSVRIDNSEYELYSAALDTTFAVINKNGNSTSIRVAGNFTARHLPWYRKNPLLTLEDQYKLYSAEPLTEAYHYINKLCEHKYAKFSTTSELFLRHIHEEYEKEIIDGGVSFIPKRQESP